MDVYSIYGFIMLFYICLMEVFILLMVQKVKTSVQKKNPNPVWNEVLQISVTNPTKPVHLVSLLFQLVQHICSLKLNKLWKYKNMA